MKGSRLVERLNAGKSQKLALYGTSLSDQLAPLLQAALKTSFGEQIEVVNAALSGKASRTALDELEARVLSQKPDAILLEFAINDAFRYEPPQYDETTRDRGISVAQSRQNLELLVEKIKGALPECEIILQTMNPAWDAPDGKMAGTKRPDLSAFFAGYRLVALARGLLLLDHEPVWRELQQTQPERFAALIPDGVHPTPAAIGQILVPRILSGLGI